MDKEKMFNILMDFCHDFTVTDLTVDDWDWWVEKWIDEKFPIDK